MVSSRSRVQSRKSAFTLIELLVVIAIIAILAAILFPVFAKAREKARQASCLSNTKQIGLGIMQYTQDFDELYPERQLNGLGENGDWEVTIAPYVKSVQVMVCPSNPSKSNGSYAPGFFASYAANRGTDCPFHDTGDNPNTTSLAALQSPANTILVVESKYSYTDFNVTVPGYFNGALFAGHTTFSNYAFADGHSKAMKPLQTLDYNDGGSNNTVNMWTNDNYTFVNPAPVNTSGAVTKSDASGYTVLNTATTQYPN